MKKGSKKWNWMMDWCNQQGLAPADSSVWKLAEEAWGQSPRKEHNQTQVEDMEWGE